MEYPILFSAPMVRAILDGRKTQTRRVVKPQPVLWEGFNGKPAFVPPLCANGLEAVGIEHADTTMVRCPFGQPGDTLWVKETFVEVIHTSPATDEPIPVTKGDRLLQHASKRSDGRWNYDGRLLCYRATTELTEFCDGDGFSGEFANRDDMPRWRSAIHMPRWASRITLLVKSVRVERLQEITDSDMEAEGIFDFMRSMNRGQDNRVVRIRCGQQFMGRPELCNDAAFARRAGFQVLWDSINAKKHPWASNPWVWVVEFERVKEAA